MIFIDLGATTLGWNAYQLNGNVLFGQGLTVNLSGGNNGGLGTGYKGFDDSTTTVSGSLQNAFSFVSVSTSLTQAALTTAQNVSAYAVNAANFTGDTTQTFSSQISGTTTITGTAGVNVIDLDAGLKNAPLTISGPANAYFIINVTGEIQTNQAMTLTGGGTAANILWNLTSSGTVLQTSGGDSLVGTFLATDGARSSSRSLRSTGN